MAIFRVEKTNNYTVMSNYHFREKDMSLKAKGLLSLMLSLPEQWDYSIIGLVKICKENETSIKSALEELKEFGYLEVVKYLPNQTESGRIEYEYIVYEQPKHNEKQEGKKQGVENLGVEFLGVENPTQLNTNILNTNNKKENTKEKNEELISHFNKIMEHYPKKSKEGKTKALQFFLQWINGRQINHTKIKLTDEQMFFAVMKYAKQCEENKTEDQYIKRCDNFFKETILDYVEV